MREDSGDKEFRRKTKGLKGEQEMTLIGESTITLWLYAKLPTCMLDFTNSC